MERLERAFGLLDKPVGMIAAVVGFAIGILLAKAMM